MNQRFVRILVLIILILVSATAAATGSTYNWESANLIVVESTKSGDLTTLTLRDKEQHLFKVYYPGDNLPDDVARSIVKFKTEFFSWRNLEMKEIKFIISLDILEIMIIPAQIRYNGVNIVSAIPAGIVFIHDPVSPGGTGLQYDFKILKENLIARVTGKYTTEAEFDKHLFRVYDNPKAYLPNTERMTDATGVNPTVTATTRPKPTGISSGTIGPTPTTRSAKPTSSTRPAGNPTPTGTGSANSTGSSGIANADFEFLLEKIIQLQVENERLRLALLALENKGLFDEVHPISREVILKVISLRQQYPTLTFAQLFSQLKKDGLQISKQELYLILAVYFNEFYDQYL